MNNIYFSEIQFEIKIAHIQQQILGPVFFKPQIRQQS
jgi:hypothetical protein